MFNQIINCLRLLKNNSLTYRELTLALNLNIDQVTQLISYINQQESNLIVYKLGSLHLNKVVDYLDSMDLTANLSEYSLYVLDVVDSTNNYILENIDKLKDKTIVTTEFQFAGRGRRDNRWLSRIAHDLTCSILVELPLSGNYDPLPLSISIALHRTLRNLGVYCNIKWPNDILLLDGRKISGILVDMLKRDNKQYAIIGIGIDNILNWNRTELLISLVNNVQLIIDEYLLLGFSLHRQEWLDNCIHLNKGINIHHLNGQIDTGVHSSLSLIGQLELTLANNEIKQYSSSDVSLRFSLSKYYLLIDAGNSAVKAAIYEEDKLFKYLSFKTDELDLTELNNLNKLFKFTMILGSSVIDPVKVVLINQCVPNIQWITPRPLAHGLHLNSNMDNTQLGSDIWLMAIGAYNQFHKDMVVVSCGTAFVVSLVKANGSLHGVKIIAGLTKQLEVLSTSTAKINLITGGEYKDYPTNTPDAVISGIIDGYLGIINTGIANLTNYSTSSRPIVVVNGGYAKWLSSFISNQEVQVFDNLVFNGLQHFI